jgi:hypothetical protein
MFCSNCGKGISEDDRFCNRCGHEQRLFQEHLIEDSELTDNNDLFSEENENENTEYIENETYQIVDSEVVAIKEDGLLKKVLKGVGTGGLVVGGGFLYISYSILHFLFVAFVGLSMIGLSISLFSEGSIISGLVALFIGTPLAIGIASYFFMIFLFLLILALIIWGIISIFGFDVSFGSVWGGFLFLLKVLGFGGYAFFWVSSFIEAARNKSTASFFKENWFYVPIFLFLFWLFF